jgi:hypothetical protein
MFFLHEGVAWLLLLTQKNTRNMSKELKLIQMWCDHVDKLDLLFLFSIMNEKVEIKE